MINLESVLRLEGKKAFWFVFAVSAFLCLLGSWLYPIYILDESKNAEAAREMLANLDFIVPTFNGVLRTDKPVLHYYFMMLGYKLFGVNAFGARFFSGIAGAFTIALAFSFIRKLCTKQLAWVFVGICWAATFFIQEFHLAVPDPYLILFVSLGCWCFIAFVQTNEKIYIWGMYASLGFGVLVKGPVAIALPGLSFLIYLIATKALNWKVFSKFKVLPGALLLLTIAVPWYILVHKATNGAWTEGFFLKHNLDRFSNKMEGHGGPFVLTWAFVLLGLMPFSFFAFKSIGDVFRERKENTVLFFALIVSLVFIGFFSIAQTKLPNYPMPCYPFLALLIALGIKKVSESSQVKWHEKLVVWVIVVITLALPVGGFIALKNDASLAEASVWALLLFLPAIIVFVGVFKWFRKEMVQSFQLVILGWILIGGFVFTVIYPKLTNTSPVAKASKLLEDREVIAYKRFDAAFPINLKKIIPVVKDEKALVDYISKKPEVLVITNTRSKTQLKALKKNDRLRLVLEQKALFESHTTRIFEVVK